MKKIQMKSKSQKNGWLITFEGVETCGKTTQAGLLSDFLTRKKIKHISTREPGGTEFGERIKQLILHPPENKISRLAELLLFGADRAEHVTDVIRPALERGLLVICDRFIDSTTAYQLGGRALPAATVQTVNNISSGGLVPDITFLFYLDLKEMKKRLVLRGRPVDRFETEQIGFHQKIQKQFLKLARAGRRFIILNGSDPIEKNARIIRETVLKKTGRI